MLELQQILWRSAGSEFQLRIPRLSIKPGITLLVGRNGAGKSSLLKLLATAQFPAAGEIRYNGLTVERDLPVIRSMIGFVPTGIELYDEMKAAKLLHYLAELKGGANQQHLDFLMDAFHITPFKTKKIKTLAQGIRQRIALAQAWIGSPAYIFLDEPLNALDSLERLRFIRFMASNAREQTIVVSTHELNEWDVWADQVIWLEGGQIRYHGSIEDWNHGLQLSVWEGQLDSVACSELDPAIILHMRSEDRVYTVRCIGQEPPAAHFTKQTTSLEDAYFIRCRCSDRSRSIG
ncbi:ATP-binding cassette domain-containing protein [Paenibacillus nasutitermitis]|uniref:ABC transporter ATP-binding protein n=1 Tax=Paenibacillus nasutitermitis TaxID=1652958 RepID=A0A916YL03_9BACL|nr:ABC transporter ATP-binding protein [Paenibacillus nasutitermitis]GGD48815.1 ABC transporter ATP-binding protein [Paenibacillus nasutitermitis]